MCGWMVLCKAGPLHILSASVGVTLEGFSSSWGHMVRRREEGPQAMRAEAGLFQLSPGPEMTLPFLPGLAGPKQGRKVMSGSSCHG